MGKATVTYREVRFIIEEELTQVYVHCEAGGDCPFGVQGWHHKTFPPSLNICQIMSLWGEGDDPVLWPLDAPK